MLLFRKPAKDVFDNDDCSVHDDAEIHCAEGKEVGRDATPAEADKGGQERQRDHERDDKGSAKVAEEEEEDECDEHRAFCEILKHSAQGGIDQPRAIVEGNDLNTS